LPNIFLFGKKRKNKVNQLILIMDKEEQKNLIIEIMQEDEKDGLYDIIEF
tara:strand:+ start:97 stop:246 length:150 start_codon:yes stop_codon:yes gene_type:complete